VAARSVCKRVLEGKMAFVFTPAASNQDIKENEYGTGKDIKFSNFSSCIGIVALTAPHDSCIGLHVVMINAADEYFSAADVPSVVNVFQTLNYDAHSVQIVGFIETWEDVIGPAYQALVQALNPVSQQGNEKEGGYDAKVENGALVVTFKQTK
jgi:hypothetical protein